jgi:hypothetical protein
MKKIFSLAMIVVLFASCSQDVQFNNPSVQGMKDGYLWRAKASSATIDVINNTLTITAYSQFETLKIIVLVPSRPVSIANPMIYLLGTNPGNSITFDYVLDGQTVNYISGLKVDDGQVKITEYDIVNRTVTGSFRFNATNTDVNSTSPEVVNFIEGVVYKVPIY